MKGNENEKKEAGFSGGCREDRKKEKDEDQLMRCQREGGGRGKIREKEKD